MVQLGIGIVKNVDPVNYKVDVWSEDFGPLKNVQYAGAVSNTVGSGVIFIPEEQSRCIVAKMPKDVFYILGFIVVDGPKLDIDGKVVGIEKGFNGQRPKDWNPGDVGIAGPAGDSYVKAEVSGNIDVHGGPLCQISLVPDVNNLIHILTDQLKLFVGNSEINWTNDRKARTTDFEMNCQSTPDQDTQVVSIKMGKKADLLKILIDDSIVLGVDKNKAVTISGSEFSVKIGNSDVITVNKNKTVKINNSLTVKP